MEERFGVDSLSESKHKAHVIETFGRPSGVSKPIALLHIDVDINVYDPRSLPQERLDQQKVVDGFWRWVAAQNTAVAAVRAWFEYSGESFAPIVGLPLPVPSGIGAFSSIPGLWLTKTQDGKEGPVTLYEVLLRGEAGSLRLHTEFRAALEGSEDVFVSLLSRATEIAGFAVQSKAEHQVIR